MNPHDNSPILRTVARFSVPLTLLVSVIIFFQGHQLPGGGFISGVLAAVAGVIHLIAFENSVLLRVTWWRLAVTGLLISLLTGSMPMLFGQALMDHTVWHFQLGAWGDAHLPTATFYDLGVSLVVIGTLMTAVVELGTERSSWNC